MNIPNLRLHDTFLPTRRTLLQRLKNMDDSDSWREFFDTYAALIYRYALRYGLTQAEAEDVVQETVIEVSRKMPGFTYDPQRSFKGWLLHTTRWRIHDQLRKRRGAAAVRLGPPPEGGRTDLMDRIPDPAGDYHEQMWEEEWQTNLLAAAMDKIKARVKPRQYQVFDLHVIKGWPVEKVAETLNVTKSQVYLAKLRISRLLKEQVERLKDKVG
jgi:RNA polymerase sigma-70 factor (ECF subfamily)